MKNSHKFLVVIISSIVLPLFVSCSSGATEFTRPTGADSIVGECSPAVAESGITATETAQALIDTIGAANFVYELDAVQRYTWSVLPVPVVERPDQGARLGDLNAEAKTLLCTLVDATLSDSGVEIVYGSMSSDEVLGATVNRRDREYTKDNYWVSIFGDPFNDAMWAYQIEGHHLGINVAVLGDDIMVGPNLYGGYPLFDEDGTLFLVDQERLALAFSAALTTDQHTQMVISDSPSEVDVSSESASYAFIEPATIGLNGSQLNAEQQIALTALIDSYVETLPAAQATVVKMSVSGELDQAIISWEGSTDAKPFGYGIRLPSLHIFYSNEDDPEHAHILFRLPNNDYGQSLTN
ncbi:MAG: DUF3500 domain-containing protein [Chloroflexota bacterium]